MSERIKNHKEQLQCTKEQFYFLEYNAVHSDESQPMFLRNKFLPSSVPNITISKKPV
jgi:hypothetical protein